MCHPHVRYVGEPRPGLDWARNRVIMEAKGEIIAYTDDDVIVDAGWVSALAQIFVENSEVMAVTGLVVPYELETEAQLFLRCTVALGVALNANGVGWQTLKVTGGGGDHGAGQFGTGANMAIVESCSRRSVVLIQP